MSNTAFDLTLFSPREFSWPNPMIGIRAILPGIGNSLSSINYLCVTLDCDATVITRYMAIYVHRGATDLYLAKSRTGQAAGQTGTYLIYPEATPSTTFSTVMNYIEIPDWPLIRGTDNIYIDPDNLQAGDQISDIYICYRTWNAK